HGCQPRVAATGRGPRSGAVAKVAPPGPVPDGHRHHPGAAAQPQAAHRARARLPQPGTQLRGRGGVLLHPGQVLPRLPGHRATHPNPAPRSFLRMAFRRLLPTTILTPAMAPRHARGPTVRLIGYTPSLDRLFSAWRTTERTRFG